MKKVLLIVDPQIDFITGSLSVYGAVEAMDYLVNWIYINQNRLSEIVITQDWHPVNHCSFTSQGGIWPTHCVERTEGAKIYPKLQSTINKIEKKWHPCSFYLQRDR